jgi:hypothetical protein
VVAAVRVRPEKVDKRLQKRGVRLFFSPDPFELDGGSPDHPFDKPVLDHQGTDRKHGVDLPSSHQAALDDRRPGCREATRQSILFKQIGRRIALIQVKKLDRGLEKSI